MRNPTRDAALLVAALLLLGGPQMAFAQAAAGADRVVGEPVAEEQVVVEDVTLDGERITATVVNRMSNEVRNVRLLVRYNFEWNDEFHPGEASPGTGSVVALGEAVPAGGSVEFTHTPSEPLPQRDDGFFVPRVEVLGFVEVVPPPGTTGR